MRKKNKPNDEIFERMIELKSNLSFGLELAQLTHTREQLKLKKLMYIYETVVEVHYVHTNPTVVRPLTFNVFSILYQGLVSCVVEKYIRVRGPNEFHPVCNVLSERIHHL